MNQICFAAATSWALVFSPPAPGELGFTCYGEQFLCQIAADGATRGLQIAGLYPKMQAQCVEQPPTKFDPKTGMPIKP